MKKCIFDDQSDVIGPINPPTSKGHRFILAITDYFSKWAEVVLPEGSKDIKHDQVHQASYTLPFWCIPTNCP